MHDGGRADAQNEQSVHVEEEDTKGEETSSDDEQERTGKGLPPLVLAQPFMYHFIRLRGLGNPTVAAAAAAMSDLITHSTPLAAVAAVSAEIAQRYKHLSESEATVLDVLRRLAQGGSIYKVWIEEDELLKSMDPDLSNDDRRRLLARMKSRDILEEGAGKWRAVW